MRRHSGFSLVELMVTVVIIGVLSIVAIVAYKRYFAKARNSEVISMFGEIRVKEEAYRTEFSQYLSTSTISEADTYPPIVNGKEPIPKYWGPPVAADPKLPAPVAMNAQWTQLGVNPGRTQVYCSYNVVAGPPAGWNYVGYAAAGAFVQPFFANIAPQTDHWWAAIAMCDNDNVAGTLYDGNNAVYITASNNGTLLDKASAR